MYTQMWKASLTSVKTMFAVSEVWRGAIACGMRPESDANEEKLGEKTPVQ